MGATINEAPVSAMVLDGVRMASAWVDGHRVWSSGPPVRNVDLGWERARTEGLPVMFLGSSTTAGFGTTRNESFVTQMVAAICKQAPGAPAHRPITQSTGTTSSTASTGFHFLNAGVGATRSQNYYNTDRHNLLVSFAPKIVVHMIGSNDYAGQVALNAYTASLGSVVDRIDNRGASSNPLTHIFIHSYRREDRADTGITWEQYGTALREFCAGRDNCHFVDAYSWFEHLREDGVEYLQSDRIHATWRGNELLARSVAAALGFDAHDDDMIYGIEAESLTVGNGDQAHVFNPSSGSLVNYAMRATTGDAPVMRVRDGVKSLDFTGRKRMETAGWPGVHSLPITAYFVTNSLGNGGDNLQPFFTRSVSGDDGYLWAWRERDSDLLKGASNTALNDGVPLPRDVAGSPAVIAVSFLASGHMRFYVNSILGQATEIRSPAENNAPWMRSLKIGTNTGNTAFSEMDVREMHWHHGANPDTVARRIRQLADKHNITIPTRVSEWDSTDQVGLHYDTVPDWADTIEAVAVGGGGGGAGGGLISTGDGGRAGTWAQVSHPVDPGRPIVVLAGGIGLAGSFNSSDGTAGTGSYVRLETRTGEEILRANGGGPGTSTNGNQPGRSAGTYTAFGRTFTGGDAASNGQVGNIPGGGGGPGAPFNAGRNGARGRVWWRYIAH